VLDGVLQQLHVALLRLDVHYRVDLEPLPLRNVRVRELVLIERSRIAWVLGLAGLGGVFGVAVPQTGWLLGPAVAAAVLVGLAQQTLP